MPASYPSTIVKGDGIHKELGKHYAI